MKKPIASVQLGVARLGLILSDLPDDAARGEWIRKFHRALALNDPSLDEYAAELLQDVEKYRDSERARKSGFRRNPPESAGIPRNPSVSDTQTDRQSDRQTDSKTENKEEINNPLLISPKGEEPEKKRGKGAKVAFEPPSLMEVKEYVAEHKLPVDADAWFAYYLANGWKVGRNPMKNWKAAVRYWSRNGAGGAIARENRKPQERTLGAGRMSEEETMRYLQRLRNMGD